VKEDDKAMRVFKKNINKKYAPMILEFLTICDLLMEEPSSILPTSGVHMTIDSIMTKDKGGKELVKFAEQTAITLVGNHLTRAQIRNIFTEVRKIEASWDARPEESMRRLNMLKPKLDYSAARNKSVEVLKVVLTDDIDKVAEVADNNAEERDRRFRVFMDLFEAILAYHRAKGGRSS
jgi:CRISPR-associated protein Csm2